MTKVQNSHLRQGYGGQAKFKILTVILVSCFLFLVSFQVAFAQFTPIVHCGPEFGRSCNICDLAVLGMRITTFLIENIAVPLAGLMIVVGGLMIMFGAASESRVTAGKKILTNALFGIIIVFISWLAVDTIIKALTGNLAAGSVGKFIGTAGPWNKIDSSSCAL